MMQLMDLNNRWVYRGSFTTPPCLRFVYWNVLTTIYPISKRHLDQFKGQLARGNDGQLAEWGNYRETQPIDNHNVARVSSDVQQLMGSSNGDLAVVSPVGESESWWSDEGPTYNIEINLFNSCK
jgi:hypothetical protein